MSWRVIGLAWTITLLGALAMGGCGSRELMPYLGRWKADFLVTRMTDKGTQKDRDRESLHGYLQLYATHQSYKLHLEGEQEAIDLTGTWSVNGKNLTLNITDLKIDDQGGSEHRDPNLKFIQPKDLRAVYERELVTHVSQDKKTLMGLDLEMGHLVGHHVFTRSND